MFKKLAGLQDMKERLEIYKLLKLSLSASLRLAEITSLAVLIAGLGWFIGAESEKIFGPLGGPWVSAGISILIMLFVPALARLPFLLAKGRLKAAFKLDPRPESARLKEIMAGGLRRLSLIWPLSMLLYAGLLKLNLWQWAFLALILGAALVAINSFFPRFMRPEKLRPLREDDLDPNLLAKIESWKPKTGVSPQDILISSAFSPELSFPKVTGIGRGTRLIISEKALASFPPREISVLVAASVMEAMVKAPIKFMLLRLCALTAAVPLASILISAAGRLLWGYPIISSPALITLVWAAAWAGFNISDFAVSFSSRSLNVQLATAAAAVLKDPAALESALKTAGREC